LFSKNILNLIASGKDIHYFEKLSNKIIEKIDKIKKERLFKK